ncbi:PGF-pre-PGF domain-containing protein [Candidatus Woesearchaeota archaeon]|nr:PGF-pre-PGF domain-containing protein [Candidatus Woesearchaeota archaeon]
MQKEVKHRLFNSRDAKVNLVMLVGIIAIFILIFLSFEVPVANAIFNVTLISPTDKAINSSRTINFTFNVVLGGTDASPDDLANCSVYTNITGTWAKTFTNSSGANGGVSSNLTNSTSVVSWMNFTFSRDGLFNWSVECENATLGAAGIGYNFSLNRSLLIDTTVPRVTGLVPNASFAQMSDAANRQYLIGNFTGWPIQFSVNVSENNTYNVWYILNSSISAGVNDDLENTTKGGSIPTGNITMNLQSQGNDYKVYAANVSLNFSSRWRNPGPHSVVFCANDTAGNKKCSGSYDFVIMGLNVTDLINYMRTVTFNDTASVNITFGNGTVLSGGDTPDVYDSGNASIESFINPLAKNYTFIFNFSAFGRVSRVHIIGLTVDEKQLGNASNTNISSATSLEVLQAMGTSFNTTMAGADFRRFIPDFIRYRFGIIEIRGTGYSKRLYCSGATVSSPNCSLIRQCNASVWSVYNSSAEIETINSGIDPGDPGACFLESGTLNGEALKSGSTYVLVKHFSNGALGNETIGPTFNTTVPTNASVVSFNTSSVAARMINFSVYDTGGMGINLTKNYTINLTIYLGSTNIRNFTYLNHSSTNLTCYTLDTTSPGNTTEVYCNATFNFNSNGTYMFNMSAVDASNNANFNISGRTLTVDQIPPLVTNFTVTNGSDLNMLTTDAMTFGNISIGSTNPLNTPVTGTGTWAQGRQMRFFANVSDNLTQPLDVDLQLFNESSGSWQTINTTTHNNVTGARNNMSGTGTNSNWTINLTYTPYIGRGVFEGHNVTFRVLVNDTLGNRNTNGSDGRGVVMNITVQINDTVKPTLQVTIGNSTNLNYSNSTSATPMIVWNISESNDIRYIAVQVDSETSSSCNLYTNFTTISDTRARRNGTLTVKGKEDDASCTGLANGTHTVRLTSEDVWGNSELYIHSFQLQSGRPGLVFNNITTRASGAGVTSNKAIVNNTNITSSFGLGFYGLGGSVNIHNLTYVSSCNSSSTVVFNNGTVVYPFNESTCPTTSGNRTLTVTVTDENGQSNSTVFGFVVDNIGPNITLNSPVDTAQIVNIGNISVTSFDNDSGISSIGYYLDSYEDRSDTRFNFTGVNYYPASADSIELVGGKGTTFIFNTTINFTPGTHTIKISINDTLGNIKNSSLITFTKTGSFDFSTVNYSMDIYSNDTFGERLQNVRMRVKTGAGYEDTTTTNETSGNGTSALTVEILFNINGSINVSLTEINTTAVNWDKINFTPFVNVTSTTFAANGIQNVTQKIELNWTNKVSQAVIFNNSLLNFAPNNNSYYGIVVFPKNTSVNSSTANKTTIQEFWWLTDVGNVASKTNISKCTEGFSSASATPCWNYTSGGRTIVQVPYFGIVVAVNDTEAPTVNGTIPRQSNQSTGMFVPNITVSSDAVSCLSSVNSTVPNVTMIKSGNICLGQTERFKNLNSLDGNYNFTFTVTDAAGNINRYVWKFNVTDALAPNMGSISSGADRTTATVTISDVNESVNATVILGTSNSSLTSIAVETDFNTTQVVSISGLTASTTYFYNVTVCDFNGNCLGNGTRSFTTTAAAAAASTTTSSSSGGGGGGAAPVSNTESSTGAAWDALAAGSTGTLTSKDAKIAIVGITFSAKNALSNPSLSLESMKSNPLSTAAAGKVYQYLQILNKNMADSDISGVTINFKVPRAWLTANGVAEGDVALYRYSGGTWNQLSTTMTSSDAEYVTYSASSPGFSTYAVGNKEAAPVTQPTEQPTTPTETPTMPTTPTETPTMPTTPTETPTEEVKKGIGKAAVAWIVVLIIAALGALGYFLYQKKKEA